MENYNGYINLGQMKDVQYLNVNGLPSVVIPAGVNRIRVTKNEQGKLSAVVGIKCDAVSDGWREKEREQHKDDANWSESRATSHLIVRTYGKQEREKIFRKMRESLLKEWGTEKVMEEMKRVLKQDGSEGLPAIDNVRGWDKICFNELDRKSRIGRLSMSNYGGAAVAAPVTSVAPAEMVVNEEEIDDLPF